MKPLAAALAGIVLGAGVMTAGTAMAPDTDSERIGALEERVAYLEAAQAAQADDIGDQGADIASVRRLAEFANNMIARCIRVQPSRWRRVGSRYVLVAAPTEPLLPHTLWFVNMPKGCV